MRHRADPGLSSLAAEAREGARGARVRLSVGAGVILLLAGLVIAVLVTTFAPRGGVRDLDQVPSRAPSATPVAGGGGAGGSTGAAAAGPVLLVHVLGAVVRPGIVELKPGARVLDAIASAGGLVAEADAGGVNLARPVSDGEQLVVPRQGEIPSPQAVGPGAGAGSGAGAAGAAAGAPVNVNRATAAELESLPRIGPALAQRIVDWREAHGPFGSLADLMKVSGIGQKLFDGLAGLITV